MRRGRGSSFSAHAPRLSPASHKMLCLAMELWQVKLLTPRVLQVLRRLPTLPTLPRLRRQCLLVCAQSRGRLLHPASAPHAGCSAARAHQSSRGAWTLSAAACSPPAALMQHSRVSEELLLVQVLSIGSRCCIARAAHIGRRWRRLQLRRPPPLLQLPLLLQLLLLLQSPALQLPLRPTRAATSRRRRLAACSSST